jgi:MFS family permease
VLASDAGRVRGCRVQKSGTRQAWLAISLLTAAYVFINYVDRGALPTVENRVLDDLHLGSLQLGFVLGVFSITYVSLMPFLGRLCDRVGAMPVLAAGLVLWSVATILTGLAGGFASLLMLRLALGVGESVAFPGTSKLLAQAVPAEHLGLANGIFNFGYLVGPAAGIFLAGQVMTHYGWRPVFFVLGAASLFWLLPWWLMRRQGHGAANGPATDGAPQGAPPLLLILRQRSLWGCALGHFASNWCYYVILNFLPMYLQKGRGFDEQTMLQINFRAFLFNAVVTMLFGWLADTLRKRGVGATPLFKWYMGASHAGAVGCFLAMVMLPAQGSVVALFGYMVCVSAQSAAIFVIPQIIAGPAAAGSWVGIQNAIGNIPGFLAVTISGYIAQRTGHLDMAFSLAAAVSILGVFGWVLVMQRVEPLDWAAAAARRKT